MYSTNNVNDALAMRDHILRLEAEISKLQAEIKKRDDEDVSKKLEELARIPVADCVSLEPPHESIDDSVDEWRCFWDSDKWGCGCGATALEAVNDALIDAYDYQKEVDKKNEQEKTR